MSLQPLQPPYHPVVHGVFVLQQRQRVICQLFVPWEARPSPPLQGSVLGV